MKRTIIMLALCAPLTLGAQTWEMGLYHQTQFVRADKEFEKSGHLYYAQGWYAQSEKRGGWGFISADTGNFAFTLGEYYTFAKYFEGGLALGTESNRREQGQMYSLFGRFAGYARVGTIDTDKLFLDFYYEGGPSTKHWARKFNAGWYQANAAFSVGRILFGGFSQTGLGTGPRIRESVETKYTDFRIWGSPAMFEKIEGKWQRKAVIGLDLVFHSKK